MKLDPRDRKLLIGFAVVIVTLIVAAAFFEGPEKAKIAYPSSYSADSNGAKAAYLLLKEQGYDVQRWERPPEELPIPGRGSLLILAEPSWRRSDEANHKAALQKFVASGGRVLAIGILAAAMFPQDESEFRYSPETKRQTCTPQLPSSITRGGPMRMSPQAAWKAKNLGHVVHYKCGNDAVVLTYAVGQGEIVWWANDIPLTNAGIREPGNVELFLNSIGDPKTRIFWDEYFHGDSSSHWSSIWDTPVAWGLAQFGILLLGAMITFSRRLGPVRPLVRPSRLSPLEFVETMGTLYHRARSAQIALEVGWERFRFLVKKRLGVRTDAPVAEVARAFGERLGASGPDLARVLADCEDGLHDPYLDQERAVELLRSLNDYARVLQDAGRSPEKHP